MKFEELVRARYSVRKFKDDDIDAERLSAILEAGRVAPTACNYQPQKIYVVKNPEAKKAIAKVCRYTFDAPVILVVGYDKERDWKNKLMPPYSSGETDAAIVCTHMMLEAHEIGVGTCWVMSFDPDAMRKAYNIPSNFEPYALLVMGYPHPDSKPFDMHSSYRPIDEVVFYENF